ncbi:MAG: DUF2878 domain-containing protein [Planctomycetota bacterium]
MIGKLLNLTWYQLCWLACCLGAGRGLVWLGPVCVAVLTVLHLWFVARDRTREAIMLAVAAVFGYLVDSGIVLTGFLDFPDQARLGGPSTIWMVALWVAFATTLHGFFGFLRNRYVLAGVIGLLTGGPAYYIGSRIDAVTLPRGDLIGTVVVSLVWLVALPALVWLADRTWPRDALDAPSSTSATTPKEQLA